MKNILATLLVLCIAHFSIAQCNPYFTFSEGNKVEYTDYNAKGKMQGRSVTTIKNVQETGTTFQFTGNTKVYDKKNKDITEVEYNAKCVDGTYHFDMSKFAMNNSNTEGMEGFSVDIEGDAMELPSELSTGMQLRELNFTSKLNFDDSENPNPMASATLTKMNFTVSDRKVESKETISAGGKNYECYKITYTITTKMKIIGINKTIEAKGVEYYAKGVGMVKSESYNKKGKLLSYSLLTNIEK